jgi:hypothetical protein
MDVIGRYFDAMRAHDWSALGDCLADEGLERVGPFLDVVKGKDAYLKFLSEIVPSLENYTLTIFHTHRIDDRQAVVELSERFDVEGVSAEYPEAIFFALDDGGRIRNVRIYIQQPGAAAPVAGGRAG